MLENGDIQKSLPSSAFIQQGKKETYLSIANVSGCNVVIDMVNHWL